MRKVYEKSFHLIVQKEFHISVLKNKGKYKRKMNKSFFGLELLKNKDSSES